jgi:hypothetical protein
MLYAGTPDERTNLFYGHLDTTINNRSIRILRTEMLHRNADIHDIEYDIIL